MSLSEMLIYSHHVLRKKKLMVVTPIHIKLECFLKLTLTILGFLKVSLWKLN